MSVLSTVLDSGAPEGSSDYTTLVAVHGLMWQGASFKKLLPFAAHHNARVIAINRRGYSGSVPFTDEEVALLKRLSAAPSESPDVQGEVYDFMRQRAHEIYDFLVDIVKRENLPPARGQGAHASGGIVIAGWSLGGFFMTALLANLDTFCSHSEPDGVQLKDYLRRVVHYDCPVGFRVPPVPDEYYPFLDHSLAEPAQRRARFHEWASGYYNHGEPVTPSTLSTRAALTVPPPTLHTLSPADRAAALYEAPGFTPDGPDMLLLKVADCPALHQRAFYADAGGGNQQVGGEQEWMRLERRFVWCDRSMWCPVWAAHTFEEELEEARRAGKAVRDVSFVRLRGANHFAHWDLPDETLRAFLDNEGGWVPQSRY